METIGGSFFILLSTEEVDAPTVNLVSGINNINGESIRQTDSGIRQAYVLLAAIVLLVGLIVALAAYRLSNRIVKPINTLTDSVKSLEGDNLDFHCDVNTGDETEVLALSFRSLTERIKDYIDEVQTITAEKERIGAELNVATQIQADMLPCIFPAFPDRDEFDIFASMTPAKEVGGDFYDYYMIGRETLGFLIADVSGKSIPGAMFMMTGKAVLKNLAESGMPPADVFAIANEKLNEGNDTCLFITAWMGYLDLNSGMVHAVNAGHNPPVLIRDGKAEFVNLTAGIVLAVMSGMIYKEHTIQLEKGDILFLYTDGVTEAINSEEEQYGDDRLLELLSFGDHYPEPAGENGMAGAVCEVVKEDLDKFVNGAEQFDDITMLCLRYLG
jgi:sigma-B regulation protein RsbU (phosphoserine phosphatase)